MSKWIHNKSQVEKTYQGRSVPAGSFFQIPRHLENEYAEDGLLASDINSDIVSMSRDGQTDLSIAESLRFLVSYGDASQVYFHNSSSKLSAQDTVTTSSSAPALVRGMSYVPEAGKYLVFFNGNMYTDGTSAKGEFGIYVGGIILGETKRDISCSLTLLGGLVTVSLNAIGVGTCTSTEIELDGQTPVEVKFNSTNGGTIGFKERVLMFMRIN